MNERSKKRWIGFLKTRLAGGLLCCLVLIVAYLFQFFYSNIYVDPFSSSHFSLIWLILFVCALLWTFRDKRIHGLPTELTDWPCIAAFLLVVANQIYIVIPKEVHVQLAPALSIYAIPVLVIVGLVVAGIVKLSISLYRLLINEQQKTRLQETRLRELLSSPPSLMESVIYVRKLLENKSIYQLSADEYLMLIEGCRAVDPVFFVWLKDKQIQLPPRDIVFCVLIRMRKTKEDILSIFNISDGAYRTLRFRVKGRLGMEDSDVESFLQGLG